MVQVQEKVSDLKAEQILPADELDADEFEELAGDDALLILNGYVQYWRSNEVITTFSASALPSVWQMLIHLDLDALVSSQAETKAILKAFWDQQNPEYVVAYTPTSWTHVSFMQSIGFHQVGVLPLGEAPVISWGFRKCH